MVGPFTWCEGGCSPLYMVRGWPWSAPLHGVRVAVAPLHGVRVAVVSPFTWCEGGRGQPLYMV